jgi:hypothetical protein
MGSKAQSSISSRYSAKNRRYYLRIKAKILHFEVPRI